MKLKNIITLLTSSIYLCIAVGFADTQSKAPTLPVIPTKQAVKTQPLNTHVAVEDAILVKNAWARPSFVTQQGAANNAAVYLELINNSNTDYNLIGWQCDEITDTVELHLSYVELGNSKMRPLDKLVLPAKSNVILKPLGLHIMLKECKKTLTIGDRFNLILKFDHDIEKTVPVEVRAG